MVGGYQGVPLEEPFVRIVYLVNVHVVWPRVSQGVITKSTDGLCGKKALDSNHLISCEVEECERGV